MDMFLTLKELDSSAPMQLDHALSLVASSFNSLSEKQRRQAVSKSLRNKSKLVEILNRDYPTCLGSLFKGGVESAVSNVFDRKQCFDQLS